MMATTKEVQAALVARGYSLGKTGPNRDGVDGVAGRNTVAALRAFQAASRLPVTGQADPTTTIALMGAKAALQSLPTVPVWLAEAERFAGLKEIVGTKHNATLIGWAKALGGWVASYFTNDEIPWCGLFVAHCVSATLPDEAIPNNPLGALQWKTFGVPLTVPARGAVLVFTRPGAGAGHVGFYHAEDADHYVVRGGNQSNAVTLSRIAKSRCVAIRWPSTAPLPASSRVQNSKPIAISNNEA
jgi:uncharacterized protein (TIGR02594 family)